MCTLTPKHPSWYGGGGVEHTTYGGRTTTFCVAGLAAAQSAVTGGGVCDMKIRWGVCGIVAVGDVGMLKFRIIASYAPLDLSGKAVL